MRARASAGSCSWDHRGGRPDAETVRKVLFVEDAPHIQIGCEHAMRSAGMEVLAAASAECAKTVLRRKFSGVVVTDMRLPGLDGLQILHMARELDADLPVIVIIGPGERALAVEAMRGGAYDFIERPFSPELLVEIVKRALDRRGLTLEVESLRRRLDIGCEIEARLIGASRSIERVRRSVLDLADADAPVLIVGETGTETELVARCLHDFSRREAKKFVALNCGGLSEAILDGELFGSELAAAGGARRERLLGKLEFAGNGTLFLDDIEAMPAAIQAKLLGVLQDRGLRRTDRDEVIPISARIIAAIGAEPDAEAAFSSELRDRLSAARIEVPPLRDRREDIPALYDKCLAEAAKRYGRPEPIVSADECRQLMAYDWPGNIGEMRNHADCRLLGIARDAGAVQASQQAGLTLTETVETFERALIAAELERQSGNVARSSEALRVARTTLHDKMRKYGLN